MAAFPLPFIRFLWRMWTLVKPILSMHRTALALAHHFFQWIQRVSYFVCISLRECQRGVIHCDFMIFINIINFHRIPIILDFCCWVDPQKVMFIEVQFLTTHCFNMIIYCSQLDKSLNLWFLYLYPQKLIPRNIHETTVTVIFFLYRTIVYCYSWADFYVFNSGD